MGKKFTMKRDTGELTRENRSLKLLRECNKALIMSVNEEKLLNDICRIIINTGGYLLAWIGFTEDGGEKRITPVAWAGYNEDYVKNLHVTWDDTGYGLGPTGTALKTGKSVIERDIAKTENYSPWRASAMEKGYAVSISIPLISEGNPLGTLNIYSSKTDDFNEEEKELLEELKNNLTYGIISLRAKNETILSRKIISENEARYRELINNMSNCVAVYRANEDGSDFIIVDFNKAAEKTENVKKEEIIGKSVLSVFPGVKNFGIFNIFSRVWNTGIAEYFPLSFYKDDRIAGWRDNYIYKLPSGEVVAIYDDVTERKKAEEKIRLLNTELIDKNNELQQIIYVTSHDLRSPLINIQGFSGELRRSIEDIKKIITEEDNINIKNSLSDIISNDINLYMNYISVSADKINQLLSGLLKLSRLGRTAMEIKEININNLISGIIKMFEFKINELKASIVMEQLPSCYGDETMLIQIFSNLIENALKNFSPEKPGVIRVSGYRNKDSSVYCIEDNGKGISPKYHEKIFEIFHKLEPSKEGEGIGLTIVKKIIERHNGRIWVESEINKGSSFYVLLPDGGGTCG